MFFLILRFFVSQKKPREKPSKTGAKAADTRNKFREMRAQMKVKLQEKGNDSQVSS